MSILGGLRSRKGAPSGAPGKICYAIGDIHGRADLLSDLLKRIEQHRLQRPDLEAIVVTLGDVIDRGPDSRAVIEQLMRPLTFAARLLCIKGNHEDMLLRGLSGEPELLQTWLDQGGLAFARSYGVDRRMLDQQPLEVVEHNILSVIPAAHMAFLQSFIDSVRFGDYLLVHAGIRPGVAFDRQSPADMKWIRQPFLKSNADHGMVVVHGHSISLVIEECSNRIGIDTGAYRSDTLTCLWIEHGRRGFIQTG